MNIFNWFAKDPKPFVLSPNPAYAVNTSHKGKIALVLGGGGSYGRFEIGVIKFMADCGLLGHVDMVIGTSVGGLNALFASRYWGAFDKVVDIWNTRVIKNTDIYSGEIPNSIGSAIARATGFMFGDKKSLVKPKGLYFLLDMFLKDSTFYDLPIPTYITATDIKAKKRVVFSKEETPLVRCTIAGRSSSAIPLIFPHVDYKDMVLCDGGIANNNPVEVAIENGATKVILIGCTPNNMPLPNIKDMVDDGVNSLATALHLAEEDNWDIVEGGKIPFIGLWPERLDKLGKSILDFDNMEAMQYGNDIAYKYLKQDYCNEFLAK